MATLKEKLKSHFIGSIPNKTLSGLISAANYELFKRHGYIERELPDYYAFTSAFMLEMLLRSGRAPQRSSVLSVGCRVDHLISFTALFKNVFHFTMVEMEGAAEILAKLEKYNFHQFVGDFFSVEPERFCNTTGSSEVDIVLSHAAVHCMSELRYGNAAALKSDQWGGIERPYFFARKLRQL